LHAQARQERKAAYEVTSQDVTKWQPMVKVSGAPSRCSVQGHAVHAGMPNAAVDMARVKSATAGLLAVKGSQQRTPCNLQANREAPTLAFSKPRGGAAKATTTAALTAQFLPETDMEAEVAAMLQAAGMHSAKAVEESEDALALKVGCMYG
jgi:U3 small nucleolar RNA-associated protein 14